MTSAPASERVRRRLPPAERRHQILEAAADLLVEHGLEQLRVETVAQRVGITKAAVFYHFGSRDELLAAVYEFAFEQVHQTIPGAAEGADTEAQLRAIIRNSLQPPVPRDPRSADAIISILDRARTESGKLEEVRDRRRIEAMAYLADLIHRGFDLDPTRSIFIAVTFGAGHGGFKPAWQLSGWSLDDAVEFYLQLFLAAIERAKAKPRAGR